jgi:C4-dicarboxylate-specific signal transduction histidine kinase
VHVIVQENGPAIATQFLPRIFDPFFTTKGAVHGVGLGLFVVEGLVRTAGGRLFARNRDTGGAWFRLDLPRVHDMHGADTASHEPANDHGAMRAVGLAGS